MTSIGVDSGASFTRIWDGEHEVFRLRTPHTYAQYLQFLYESLRSYEPIQSLAIALAAIVEKQRIVKALNLGEEWDGRNIEADIRSLLRVTGKILILQDTEAAGYAVQNQELHGMEPTMLVTLSTGVGGALVTREYVMPLEVGHITLNLSGNSTKCGCGQYGCVAADLSGTELYKRLGVQLEHLDDPEFWSNYGIELGKFFLILSALFKLKQIALIGGVSQRYTLFLEQTKRYLETNLKYVSLPIVRVLQTGDRIGVYGAHWLAAHESGS
jgi:predicted NBD/HSP70 family sugar kinase